MNLGILALGLAALGGSVGIGLLVSSVLQSSARQPEMFGKFQTTMFLGIAFIEGMFFITLAMAFAMR
ncbi:ATP synthase F0 subunit C [Streptococcus hillyeri]|uniref:ATP synthase subunit c n=1 Tax=Streptococcus hillyeri TaxID=2282420 RepID=A0A3L9DUJ8_9STRE|nr:ATP synthase F0 subunit C [Streptococcus hillyeri]RLY05166.1 ATP synthase F0 subunit C [Streptococcus hillyeri]